MAPKLSGVASKVNDADLEQLLFDLISIPSVNPKFRTDEFVEKIEEAVDETQGSHSHAYVLSFCDGTFFYDGGIPTLTCGPGTMELGHSSNEYVDLNEVRLAARVFAQATENIPGTEALWHA